MARKLSNETGYWILTNQDYPESQAVLLAIEEKIELRDKKSKNECRKKSNNYETI